MQKHNIGQITVVPYKVYKILSLKIMVHSIPAL